MYKIKREIKRILNKLFNLNIPLNPTNFFEDNVIIDKSADLMANIKIGRYTYVRKNVLIDDYCEIGRYCSIANDVIIGVREHLTNNVSTSPFVPGNNSYDNTKKTIIENDVWIGTRAIIKKGVHISTGAVVGANAVVTHDVPPYAVVAGVPAKIIKYRFDEETISKLLKTEWWNLPNSELKNLDFNFTLLQKEKNR